MSDVDHFFMGPRGVARPITLDMASPEEPQLKGRVAMIRCMFVCNSVTKRLSSVYDYEKRENVTKQVHDAEFFVVTNGSDEQRKFFASTPSGSIKVGTINPDAFEVGKTYYVDFTATE